MSRALAGFGAGVGAGIGAFSGAVLGTWPTANDWRRKQGYTVTPSDETRELDNMITVSFIGAIVGAIAGGAIGAGSDSAPKQVGTSGVGALGAPGPLHNPRFP